MFLRLFAIETRKTLKNPGLWIGLAGVLFLLACATLFRHVQILNGYAEFSGGLEKDLLSGLAFFNQIGILAYAILSAGIAAFDYVDRSLHLWLTRGVSRLTLLTARLTAILFFGLLLVCVSVIAVLGLSALSRGLFFGGVDTTHLNPAALPSTVLRLFWSSLPYLALTVLLAVLSRSPFFAAGGTILYGSVVEPFAPALGGRFPWLIRYMPASLSRVLQNGALALDRHALPISPDAIMPQGQAIFVIGMIFLLLSIASFVIFSRQDLGG
jgi:ABC-type transport system involved in multi-copper enzyme maturation permease subunit